MRNQEAIAETRRHRDSQLGISVGVSVFMQNPLAPTAGEGNGSVEQLNGLVKLMARFSGHYLFTQSWT